MDWLFRKKDTCIRGYHEYKAISAAAVGEEMECRREPTNLETPLASLQLHSTASRFYSLDGVKEDNDPSLFDIA